MRTSRWITEAARQLRRGKHVVLHGHVEDLALWEGEFVPFASALDGLLQHLGYDLRAGYNLADGVTFAGPDMAPRFAAYLQDAALAAPPAGGGYRPPGRSQPLPAAAGPVAGVPYLRDADVAMAAFRRVLSACRTEAASAVVDLADKLVAGGEALGAAERLVMVQVGQASREAWRHLGPEHLAGMRNALILVARQLGQVPAWCYRDHPLFHVVAVDPPDADERRLFLQRRYRGFYGAESGEPSATLLGDFVALTDGLSRWDLEAVRLASFHDCIPVHDCRRLLDFFKHGATDHPWEKLDLAVLRQARTELRQQVIGQDQAVDAVIDVLVQARGGVSLDGSGRGSVRPKGVLFFVGPTGVGKTELAKAVTALVFRDPTAFARFDMSEYAQEHAAERLTGAPPSYVGHEAGGQLTNRMKTRPFSLILLDEIEKAHPRVMDKFLQVLDDGRLTDGLGETVYFSQSVIIFTSNLGSTRPAGAGGDGPLVAAVSPDMPYEALADHYRGVVRDHFLRIGRPELLGRIGEENVVVFDLLRPRHVAGILDKFLAGTADSLLDKYGIQLIVDPSVHLAAQAYCAQPAVVRLGGRGVRNFVQRQVLVPLNEAVLAGGIGHRLTLVAGPQGIEVRR